MVANNPLAQAPQDLSHQGEIITVRMGTAEVPPQTVRINPKETLKIEGLTFSKAKIDIIGPDVIITATATGNKIIIPGIGLFMFSLTESPHLVFDGEKISTDALLGKIGFIVNLTDKDYITYTSLHLNDHQTTKDSDVSKEAELLKQMMRQDPPPEDAPIAPENLNTSTNNYTNAGDESLVTSAVGQPPLPGQEPSTPPRSSPPPVVAGSVDSTSERTTFDFDLRLVQVGATESTPAGVRTIQGGGGTQLSFFSPAAAYQYSTETIDTLSDNSNVVIYADRDTGFAAGEMSRVIQISPNLPDGFAVTSAKITGLPAGFSIVGATYNAGDGSYTITSPTYDILGSIVFELHYTNLTTQTLPAIAVEATAEFNPASGFATPENTTLIFTDSIVFRVQPTSSAADYSYAGADWVLSSNPNENRVITGNGNNTVYGGIVKDTIITGSGNDTIYGGAGNDEINAGAGNDAVQTGTGNDSADGGAGTDTLDYSWTTGDITLTLNGATAVTATVGAGKTDQINNFENVTGGSGNDTLTGDSAANIILGGSGNDVISGGLGNDTLNGGTGINTISYLYASSGILELGLTLGTILADTGDTDTISNFQNVIGSNFIDNIYGTSGNNVLMGMGGDDRFYYSGGNDTIDGGTGINLITMFNYFGFDTTTGALNINLGGAQDANGYITASVNGGANSWLVRNIQNVQGGGFDDTIIGDNQNNSLRGFNGNDVISGGAGDDTIYGGYGANTLTGGSGTDILRFDDLDDPITMINLVNGTTEDSYGVISTFSGFEVYYLTAYDDFINMAQIGTTVYAVGGNDWIDFSSYTSGITADLEAGTSTGAVSDIIVGFTNLTGTSFNDVITGTAGNNFLYGLGGIDTLDYRNATGVVTVNFLTSTATGYGNDTFSNFENYIGSDHGSIITDGAGDNTITGGAGFDDFTYRGGTNTFDGAGGYDRVNFADGSGPVTLNLATNSAVIGGLTQTLLNFEVAVGTDYNDTMTASAGGSYLVGIDGNDILNGGAGNDTLDGGAGDDIINGGGGFDIVQYLYGTGAGVTVDLQITVSQNVGGTDGWDTITNCEGISGSDFNDTLTGDNGDNTINGNAGNDVINGNGGVDYIYGGNGNDTINGGDGNDFLYGQNNNDIINGGNGNDTIHGGAGDDTLNGGVGTDTLDYSSALPGVSVNVNLVNGTSTGDGNDSFSSFENIIGTAQNDSFTLNPNVYLNFSAINGGAGTDTVVVNNGAGTDLDNLSGAQLNTLFDNIETLNLSGATADSQWALSAADIDGMNGAATTFSLNVSQNFNINIGNGSFGGPTSGSSGVINTSSLGTQTITWGTNLTLTIQVV